MPRINQGKNDIVVRDARELTFPSWSVIIPVSVHDNRNTYA